MSDDSSENNSENAVIASNASINPYAVLNLTTNANNDEIQKAYKTLSRSFHPDKQPPGDNRDIAQQYFVQFKASYDILIDPVLRLAYDNHGMEGVRFILKSLKTYKQVEESLAQLDEGDDDATKRNITDRGKEILSEAMQFHSFCNKTRFHKPSVNAGIDLKCNSTHSTFLGEGMESNLLEVERTRINMAVTKSPNTKTTLCFGGQGSVGNGEGSSSAQLSVNYEASQGTDVNIDLDVGSTPDHTKVTFSSSRVMSNQTYVAANLSASPSENIPPGLSFTSHRSMMENRISGTWVMGLVLPKFQLQYGMLSFTAKYPDQPKYTAKFNVGMNYTPVEVIAEKSFDDEQNHTGKISWGWGPNGIDMKAITSRCLSKYCKITIGLNHVSSKGLSWLFKLQRGSVQFTVPILITTAVSPAYAVKSMYMTLFLGMVDATLGDFVRKEVNEATDTTKSLVNRALRKEEILLDREKVKRDALQQIRMMEKPAEAKRRQEEDMGGLVIVKAVYGIIGGDHIDVTTALMFWVVKGRLQLPSTTKSSMLGFYDVRHETPLALESGYVNACWKLFEKIFYGKEKDSSIVVEIPILTIRYRWRGHLYEITAADNEALSLPSSNAMKLGGHGVK